MHGTTLCFETSGAETQLGFDKESVLEQMFWRDDRPLTKGGTGSYNYNSIQTLAALAHSYNLQVLVSNDLTPDMISRIHAVLERTTASTSGRPNFDDLHSFPKSRSVNSRSHPEPFEIRMSRLEMCNRTTGQCLYEEDFLHEMFISFHYTNRLRKLVPNFQLAYAGIKASSSASTSDPKSCLTLVQHSPEETESLDADSPLVSPPSNSTDQPAVLSARRPYGQCACDSTQTVDYLILEKLDGIPLTEALKTCNVDEYLNWLVQITLSLELGVVNFGFTHYNLHTDNITIIPLSGSGKNHSTAGITKVKYWFRNQILMVAVPSLAVLKNFELSHVKHRFDSVTESSTGSKSDSSQEIHGGYSDDEAAQIGMVLNQSEHFGALGQEHLGIFHNETRPFYDLYKLIFWSLNITARSNPTVYQEIRKISKFFGHSRDKDLLKTLKDEEELGYMYSSTIGNQEKLRSLGEFFSFLLQTYPQLQSLITSLDAYTDSKSLHCENYCPLNGHTLASDTDLSANPLRFLGLRFSMERLWGLTKRVEELSRLGAQFCRVGVEDAEGNLCQPATEELMDAQNELLGFKELLDTYGEELYLDGVEKLEYDRLGIEELIAIYNAEVDALRTYPPEQKQARLLVVGGRLARQESLIGSRVAALIRDMLLLNQFATELGFEGQMLGIELSPLAAADSDP
jgi:hypothetical protein